MGQIVLETTHPDYQQLRINVRLAITPADGGEVRGPFAPSTFHLPHFHTFTLSTSHHHPVPFSSFPFPLLPSPPPLRAD